MTGYYLMHRGWMENPALGGRREPFCRRAAWAWMIEEAKWRDEPENVAGKTVVIKRGQFCHSVRFMADAWGWDEKKVRRFLSRLQDDAMIACGTVRGQSIVTLCKYEDYQVQPRGAAAATTEPAPHQRRDDAANLNTGNSGNKESSTPAVHEESGPAAAAKPVDPIQDAAVAIRKRFLSLRSELWPQESRWPAPNMTLDTIAAQWLRDGTPAELALEVVERQMRRRAEAGRPSANSLTLFADDVTNETVSLRSAAAGPKSRPTASAQPAQQQVGPVDRERDIWVARMANWRKDRVWRSVVAGPPPGEPGCKVPPDLLEPGDEDPRPTLQ